jgi:hypothetical protein
MAEKKYLRLQAGFGLAADEEDIEEQAEEAVDKVPNRSFRTPHALMWLAGAGIYVEPTAAVAAGAIRLHADGGSHAR